MSNRGGLSNAFSHLDPQERNGSRHSQISERDTLQSASLIARAEGKMNTTTTPDLFKTGRTLLIEFKDDGSTTQNHLLFTVDIKGSFSPANNTSPRKVLYLLEGPHPDHVTTLEEHFKIQQSFFMKHKRSSERGGDHRAKETPLLPSLIDPQKTWCLDYHALRLFDNNWTSNSVRCAENERHLELSRINGGLDETGIIGQKASYWLKNYDNGGWEAVIVVDVSVKHLLVGGLNEEYARISVQSKAYQGGYHNFVGDTDDQEPPRTSIFDDVVYYCEHHNSMLEIGPDPLASTVFPQKIMASHYMK